MSERITAMKKKREKGTSLLTFGAGGLLSSLFTINTTNISVLQWSIVIFNFICILIAVCLFIYYRYRIGGIEKKIESRPLNINKEVK